jgi:hypothetical protein
VDAVVDRTGGTGEVEDVIDFAHIEGFANVFFDELEARLMLKVRKIRAASGEQVIEDDNIPVFGEQSIAKMRAQKAGAAGDHSAFGTHAFLPFLNKAAGTPSG